MKLLYGLLNYFWSALAQSLSATPVSVVVVNFSWELAPLP